MFRTLQARLVLILLLLVIPLASVFVWLTLRSSQLYFQELTQEINQNLASTLVADQPGLMLGDAVDATAFSGLAKTLAMTNPGVEIYVLTREGLIIGSSVPTEMLVSEVVDIAPLETFLTSTSYPIRSTDPRNEGSEKIFSVAPLDEGKGFLYVILADSSRDSLMRNLLGSTVLQVVLWSVGVLLLFVVGIAILAYVLLTRRITKLESAMTKFRGQDFDLAGTSLMPLARPKDEIDQLQNVFIEMSTRISEQVQGLKQVDRLRRELISNVSHDLRTPLAALQGYLETLQMKEDKLSEDDKQRYLNVASRQSKRLSALVSDLFELSRFDSEAVQPNFERYPVQELVQDVVMKFHDYAAKQNIHLSMDVAADLPLVDIDLGLFERALTNLVDNAIKHTTEGEVKLELLTKANRLWVRVCDTGKGIPEEDLKHVFERYYRVANQRGSDGAGLGLAITKRIMDLHEGEVVVTSQVGVGTQFSLILPLPSSAQ